MKAERRRRQKQADAVADKYHPEGIKNLARAVLSKASKDFRRKGCLRAEAFLTGKTSGPRTEESCMEFCCEILGIKYEAAREAVKKIKTRKKSDDIPE
jgi:hypothetical protein